MNPRARVALVATLFFSLVPPSISRASTPPDTPAAEVAVDVPFLPQTEALCGGAAAAMVFRYWGQAHASVRQFEALVDRKAGGISEATLSAAITDRGWVATRLPGSIDAIRTELLARRPPIILIEDRPQRYHYVVVVGIGDEVLVHDPTWGPARHVPVAQLQRAWKAAAFWMLRVTPASGGVPDTRAEVPAPAAAPQSIASCDVALDAALDDITAEGLGRADEALGAVAKKCPGDPRPLSELAAVRFAQRRWSESAELARQALARDAGNRYAADVLGSSLFMTDDAEGALRAWNVAGRPQIDSVRIIGLTRMRYALLSEGLGLQPDTTLSADDFRLARRRLASMPDLSSTRLALRPGDDGFAVVDVAVVERPILPRQPVQWGAAAVRSAIDRELAVRIPGRTGQGETWTAAWRWWKNRPAASVGFAAPRTSSPRGLWRLGLAWEAQAYGPAGEAAMREERLRGDVALGGWITPGLQLSAIAGMDRWQLVSGDVEKSVSVGGLLEQRLSGDRITAQLSATRWLGIGSRSFSTASANLSFGSHRTPAPIVWLATTGAEIASEGSPLALWSGAGEGRTRRALLRAHPLLDGGRIDGPVFGRRLVHATTETQHWFKRPAVVRLGAAAFLDAASASHRLDGASGHAFQMDAGAGLRIRVPASSSTLRLDYARGLRDGARAWTLSWQSN